MFLYSVVFNCSLLIRFCTDFVCSKNKFNMKNCCIFDEILRV